MKKIAFFLVLWSMLFLIPRLSLGAEVRTIDIFDAVKSGDMEHVKEVLDIEPSALYFQRNISFDPGYTPLHLAASRGDYRMVLFILQWGIPADIRSQDLMTPLHMAALNWLDDNYVETITALLKYGADVNAINIYRQTPLDLAIHNGNNHLVDFLEMRGGKRGKLFIYQEPVDIAP